MYVISATPELKQIAKNDMKEVIMATPAISDGLIVIRTMGHRIRNRAIMPFRVRRSRFGFLFRRTRNRL